MKFLGVQLNPQRVVHSAVSEFLHRTRTAAQPSLLSLTELRRRDDSVDHVERTAKHVLDKVARPNPELKLNRVHGRFSQCTPCTP